MNMQMDDICLLGDCGARKEEMQNGEKKTKEMIDE